MLFLQTDKNNKIVEWPLDDAAVRRLIPNVSLPKNIDNFDLTRYNIHQVDVGVAPEGTATHKAVLDNPKFDKESGKWIRNFKLVKRVQTEIESAWNTVKARRNKLLTETDWTQLLDSPLTDEQKEAYKTYRQALRDIPSTFKSPFEVKWPTIE